MRENRPRDEEEAGGESVSRKRKRVPPLSRLLPEAIVVTVAITDDPQ